MHHEIKHQRNEIRKLKDALLDKERAVRELQHRILRLENRDTTLSSDLNEAYGPVDPKNNPMIIESFTGLNNKSIDERLEHLEELSKIKTLRTCEEYRRYGISSSGFYEIDPDGSLIGHEPFQVYCNFDLGCHNKDFCIPTKICLLIFLLMYLERAGSI